jgi:hypothetical protein
LVRLIKLIISSLLVMNEDLEKLELMLNETESIYQSLLPFCSTVQDIGTHEAPYQDQQEPHNLNDGSQTCVKPMESGANFPYERYGVLIHNENDFLFK